MQVTHFVFLQVQESIEGGALERDLSKAPSRDGKSIVGVKTRLVSVFHMFMCMDVYVYVG